MSDLISRQAAISIPLTPKGLRKYQTCNLDDAYDEGWGDYQACISQLPLAQPEQRWIPCSERMPEEHEWLGTKKFGTTISDEVYVTFENDKGERFCKHLQFQNGELSRYDQLHMDTWFKGSKPIAWMPLPEPYKEEGE